MPKVRVVDETPVAAVAVLEAARDFSARRAELWPDVHVEHLVIHGMGETWADVTEGNPWPIGFVWERLHYDWSEPGVLRGTVTDSNIFCPGSTWVLSAAPSGGLTRVEVNALRLLRGLRGRLLYPTFPTGLARQSVSAHLRHFLSELEHANSG
jgi:hypothetical protein